MDEFALDIYTPRELLAVMFDPRQTISTTQWRRLVGTRTYRSDQRQIMFDKIRASRPIAPFMHPNVAGRPIFRREGEQVYSFTPAYTKPKDVVMPGEMLELTPGELVGREALQSPEARAAQTVIAILRYHREAIERLWDYMIARSTIDGKLTIRYMTDGGLDAPPITIDYGRDPDHEVMLAGGQRWGQAGISIFDNLQKWVDIVGNAEFGGVVTDVFMGSSAAAAFVADADNESGSLYKKMNRDFRGSEELTINRGIIRTDPMNPFTYLGTLGSGISCWKVSGPGNQFQNDDRSSTDIMGTNEVVLVAPNVEMIMAFGAIQDINSLRAQEIFVKMWDENDPSGRVVMSQSAPLAIPVNPNATFKAIV